MVGVAVRFVVAGLGLFFIPSSSANQLDLSNPKSWIGHTVSLSMTRNNAKYAWYLDDTKRQDSMGHIFEVRGDAKLSKRSAKITSHSNWLVSKSPNTGNPMLCTLKGNARNILCHGVDRQGGQYFLFLEYEARLSSSGKLSIVPQRKRRVAEVVNVVQGDTGRLKQTYVESAKGSSNFWGYIIGGVAAAAALTYIFGGDSQSQGCPSGYVINNGRCEPRRYFGSENPGSLSY